ncbi:MAG: PilZ domain-containing protein [Myxococcales bacterium]|nr:PilZ domain-containing protein [Polyangiaceae bacterium]MDW8251656.1 PilZ domain-containing protein [Myxococcales bacterium]
MAEKPHFRTHERRPVRLPASLRKEDGAQLQGLVVDLSLAGAGLELIDPLEPGTQLVVEITSPTLWDPLPLRGRVVWFRQEQPRKPGRAGIQFVLDDSPQLFALFEVLAAHAYE